MAEFKFENQAGVKIECYVSEDGDVGLFCAKGHGDWGSCVEISPEMALRVAGAIAGCASEAINNNKDSQ